MTTQITNLILIRLSNEVIFCKESSGLLKTFIRWRTNRFTNFTLALAISTVFSINHFLGLSTSVERNLIQNSSKRLEELITLKYITSKAQLSILIIIKMIWPVISKPISFSVISFSIIISQITFNYRLCGIISPLKS